jgi:biofilm PGA synthesis N-glycosyltransferase PgaC
MVRPVVRPAPAAAQAVRRAGSGGVLVAPAPTTPRTAQVVALVPAHDEEAGIVDTVRSLRDQTSRPDRIIVIADNCTDSTADLARSEGAEVVETVGNVHKKAGAMNYALAAMLPHLNDDDVVLTMDADSQLMPDFIETGLRYLAYSPSRGAISGSYQAREDPSTIGLLQRIEYAQGLHIVHGRGGRIHVLSGAACMFTVEALRAVANLRGSSALPGPRGWIYHQESLTEDYELTLALKRIGYEPLNARDCVVVTDVMTTWESWVAQRLRWQRGTLDTLAMYGWVPHTRKAWVIQLWTYLRSVVPLLTVLFWAYALLFESVTFQLAWLAILPVFVLDQVVTAWRSGARGRVYAAALVPMWVYDCAQLWVYWQALLRSLRSSEATWIT